MYECKASVLCEGRHMPSVKRMNSDFVKNIYSRQSIFALDSSSYACLKRSKIMVFPDYSTVNHNLAILELSFLTIMIKTVL